MFRTKTCIIYIFLFCVYLTLIIIPAIYFMRPSQKHSETGHILEKRRWKYISEGIKNNVTIPVEIWGKASISIYLWKHILKGSLKTFQNGMVKFGNLQINNVKFVFKNGPGIVPSTVPKDIEHLVIVLNGRSLDKVKIAKHWLEFLNDLPVLKKLIVVMLGNERCENDWILPYMRTKGGLVDAVLLVYDSLLVDNEEFFQWPLGVAEYRGFPDFKESSINLLNKRPYLANFVGTVYKNSSRELLVKVVTSSEWKDKIKLITRPEWIPNETFETRQQYIEVLESSDLTLSPVGMNSECYRIYEALSLGSVPVVEDRVTPGRCDKSAPAPLRLLKYLDAPVMWITNWNSLPDILRNYHIRIQW